MSSLGRTYGLAIIVTAAIWLAVGLWLGPQALLTTIILTLLEVTFSFDNAVINAKILVQLSPFWRLMFLTIGIVFAVFIVRFILPLIIVGLTAHLDIVTVARLAFEKPDDYAAALLHATPSIEAFGGTFLLLVGAHYFIDDQKSSHWLGPIEKRLARAGRINHFALLSMVALTAVMYCTVPHERTPILAAGLIAIVLHGVLLLIDGAFSSDEHSSDTHHKTGLAAFFAFMYLQLLDASFSLDSVIGAFAITTAVVLIVAGLGAGAVWVRSMTVHLVETGALKQFRYLEHGAHWAIAVLGIVMLLKLYGFEPADWVTGSIGLVFVGLSVVSSKLRSSS